MTTPRETSESAPLTLLEVVDNILRREANFSLAREAQKRLVESHRAPQQMKRAEFKAVGR